jgi:hypothetical protein
MLEHNFQFFPNGDYQIKNLLGRRVMTLVEDYYEMGVYTWEILTLLQCSEGVYCWYKDHEVPKEDSGIGFDQVKYFAYLPTGLHYQNGNKCDAIQIDNRR